MHTDMDFPLGLERLDVAFVMSDGLARSMQAGESTQSRSGRFRADVGARGRGGLAPPYQQRARQSWVKMSWSVGAAVGAAHRASPGANAAAVNEAGNGAQTDCGDKRFHVGGRSRVIQWFLICVGDEPVGAPRESGFPIWEEASPCGWPTSTLTRADMAGECGTTAAAVTPEPPDAQPVVTATNTPSAATIAKARRHRRHRSPPRTFIVARLYNYDSFPETKITCENDPSPV